MPLRPLRRRLLLQYLLTVGLLLAGAEVLLYLLVRWAGEAELDATLRNEITKLAAAVELTHDEVRVDGKRTLLRLQQTNYSAAWQILLADGSTLLRSKHVGNTSADLPGLGGDDLPLEEVAVADAAHGEETKVRAARLRTVRERLLKPPPKGKSKRASRMPQQMVVDIRAVMSRASSDEHLAQLVWYLAGGYPVVLAVAAVGGIYLIRRAVRPVELAFDRERRFTGAASHELRTPLTALQGEIDVALRRNRTEEEYLATLQRMQPLVARMNSLVEGFLVLARAKAGSLLLGAGEVSVLTLHKAAQEAISLLPAHERVSLACTAPPDRKILGDSLLLGLAVRNLVENALLHAPESPVQVHLRADASDGIELTVEDKGPGMPEAVLAAFRSADGDGKLQRGSLAGSGLGLSIARAIIEAHGGKISIANAPELGCVAKISLSGSH